MYSLIADFFAHVEYPDDPRVEVVIRDTTCVTITTSPKQPTGPSEIMRANLIRPLAVAATLVTAPFGFSGRWLL